MDTTHRQIAKNARQAYSQRGCGILFLRKGIALMALCLLAACIDPTAEPDRPPNILLIVADDLGYTDLGVYGGEIGTPNLDALARKGMLFTDFYAASTCSPTRAMLLSGTDNHLAGLGTMTGDHVGGQKGAPGYETYLNFRVAALADLLQDAGYHTYMSGKWHLGVEDHVAPAARGFERSFALLQGGGGHFDNMGLFSADSPAEYRDDGRPVDLPEEFYSTRFYAERMIAYIDAYKDDEKPFFGYLAFTAPHWPLQAPDTSIARFRGRYDEGYNALHTARLTKLKQFGLIAENVEAHPGLVGARAWDALSDEQKRMEARKMEIYAAMVHDLDTYVGRVLNHLKAIGAYDNTFIVFMSDNGAEGHDLQNTWPNLRDWVAACCDNSYDNMGRGNSYIDYGPNWARAGIGPFRMYKGFANEGGIRVPAIVRTPGGIAGGKVHRSLVTVKDVMPTVLALAGVTHPAETGGSYKGHNVLPMQGRSMLPMLMGKASTVHGDEPVMGWELFGRRAIRKGDWKLVWTTAPYGPSDWQLFNLADDPGEIHDLTAAHPEHKQTLLDLWDAYVAENGVLVSTEPLSY